MRLLDGAVRDPETWRPILLERGHFSDSRDKDRGGERRRRKNEKEEGGVREKKREEGRRGRGRRG